MVEERGLFDTRVVVDIDRITGEVYSLVGGAGISRTIKLVNYWAASRTVRKILRKWRYTFGSGLPHDYGVCIGFEP